MRTLASKTAFLGTVGFVLIVLCLIPQRATAQDTPNAEGSQVFLYCKAKAFNKKGDIIVGYYSDSFEVELGNKTVYDVVYHEVDKYVAWLKDHKVRVDVGAPQCLAHDTRRKSDQELKEDVDAYRAKHPNGVVETGYPLSPGLSDSDSNQ